MRIEQFLSGWSNWLHEEGKSRETIRTYLSAIKHLENYLNSKCLQASEMDYIEAQYFKQYLLVDLDLNPKTVNRILFTVRNFFTYLISINEMKENYFRKVKSVKIDEGEVKRLNQNQEKLLTRILYSTEKISEWRQKRNKVIGLLSLNAGLRVSEVSNLKLNDVDLTGNKLKIVGKGTVSREVPIEKDLKRAIQEWLQIRQSNSLFLLVSQKGGKLTSTGIQNVYRSWQEMTGIKHLTPHALRHTFAYTLSQRSSLPTVQGLLGHSNIVTTTIYTSSSYEDRVKAVNTLTSFDK